MAESPRELKIDASLAWGEVIRQTANNFPDPRFRAEIYHDSPFYHLYSISSTDRYRFSSRADGVGTKIEIAERLSDHYQDPKYFKTLPFDAYAMVDGDIARDGHFFLGVTQIIDMNAAEPTVVSCIAEGAEEACHKGRFALLNGETAELGMRVSGYGPVRFNWAAVGKTLDNPEKRITGEGLKPGQPIVAVREPGMRSNGFTTAREILEADYLRQQGYSSKFRYFMDNLSDHLTEHLWGKIKLGNNSTLEYLNQLIGHDFLEQVLVPWHQLEPSLANELLRPSILYGPLMYDALGGVDGERQIDIVAAAHITGGGISEKVGRMVRPKELGAHIDSIFPDPHGVTRLLEISKTLPDEGANIIDDRGACEKWNRGIGFMVVTETSNHTEDFVKLAESLGYEAAVAGEVIDKKEIEFRGHTWTY